MRTPPLKTPVLLGTTTAHPVGHRTTAALPFATRTYGEFSASRTRAFAFALELAVVLWPFPVVTARFPLSRSQPRKRAGASNGTTKLCREVRRLGISLLQCCRPRFGASARISAVHLREQTSKL